MIQSKPKRTNRTRAYYRHHRWRCIARKRKIAKQTHWVVLKNQWGRLAKGKIHCSCGLCQTKTRLYGLPRPEKAKMEDCQQQIQEYFHWRGNIV